MKFKHIVLIIFVGSIITSCNYKCVVKCAVSSSEPAALGYKFYELDTVILNVYTPDGSFSNLVHSEVILNIDTSLYNIPTWLNFFAQSPVSDTTGDTLINSGSPQFSEWLDFSTPHDIEFIIPSNNNKVYRFSKITLAGNATQKELCREGDPLPCSNGLYISSYVLNGTTINFKPNSSGYLYLQK